jgi:hypothetical protein
MYREMNFTLRPRDTCVSLWDQGIRVFHCETKGYVYLTVRPRDTCVSLWDQGIRMFHSETTGYMYFIVRPRDTYISLWNQRIRIFHRATKEYVYLTVRPRVFDSGIKVYVESKILRNPVVLWFNHALYIDCYIWNRDGIQNVAKYCLSRTGHSSVLVGSETVTKQQIVMSNVHILYRRTEIIRECYQSIYYITCSVCSCVYWWLQNALNLRLTLRLLMSDIYIYIYIYIYGAHIYIYGAPILDVYWSHTTTQHSR